MEGEDIRYTYMYVFTVSHMPIIHNVYNFMGLRGCDSTSGKFISSREPV
jgi:hypothetical protein